MAEFRCGFCGRKTGDSRCVHDNTSYPRVFVQHECVRRKCEHQIRVLPGATNCWRYICLKCGGMKRCRVSI